MKIAVVFDDGLDKPDGVQQCILTLNKWLSAQGHEVHYVVGETKRTDLPNVHVASRNIPVKFNGNRLTIPLPTSKRKLKKLVNSIEPDVLHVHVPYSPFMGGRFMKVTPKNVGIVGTFHVLPFGKVARYGTRLLGMYLHSTLVRFNSLYAGTPVAAEFARWSMKIDAQDLPHPVDVSHFRQASHEKRHHGRIKIVFLGRLVERKGATQLVHAIAGLPKAARERIEVRLGGRGEQFTEIEDYIAKHKLADCIKLDGFIPEDAKPAYLAQADIAIFPSISGESFGISLLEPMAAGAGVVVGGNNPGYCSVLGEWPEALFDPTNTQGFTDYLANLIENELLRSTLHEAQQKAIHKYDVATVGGRWLEIYAEAIKAQRSQ